MTKKVAPNESMILSQQKRRTSALNSWAAACGAAGQKAGSMFGIVEWMLIIFLNIILGGFIIGILAIIVTIATWMGESWWGKLTYIWEALWGLGFGGMSVLVELFKPK